MIASLYSVGITFIFYRLGTKIVLIILLVQDVAMGHPFVSDFASESDDEFDAGDSDEVSIWVILFILIHFMTFLTEYFYFVELSSVLQCVLHCHFGNI